MTKAHNAFTKPRTQSLMAKERAPISLDKDRHPWKSFSIWNQQMSQDFRENQHKKLKASI